MRKLAALAAALTLALTLNACAAKPQGAVTFDDPLTTDAPAPSASASPEVSATAAPTTEPPQQQYVSGNTPDDDGFLVEMSPTSATPHFFATALAAIYNENRAILNSPQDFYAVMRDLDGDGELEVLIVWFVRTDGEIVTIVTILDLTENGNIVSSYRSEEFAEPPDVNILLEHLVLVNKADHDLQLLLYLPGELTRVELDEVDLEVFTTALQSNANGYITADQDMTEQILALDESYSPRTGE